MQCGPPLRSRSVGRPVSSAVQAPARPFESARERRRGACFRKAFVRTVARSALSAAGQFGDNQRSLSLSVSALLFYLYFILPRSLVALFFATAERQARGGEGGRGLAAYRRRPWRGGGGSTHSSPFLRLLRADSGGRLSARQKFISSRGQRHTLGCHFLHKRGRIGGPSASS